MFTKHIFVFELKFWEHLLRGENYQHICNMIVPVGIFTGHIPHVRRQVTMLQIIKQVQKCFLALILTQNVVFDGGEITWFT